MQSLACLLPMLLLLLPTVLCESQSGRSEVAQRPEFMSAHYQRSRQLQDEFKLTFSCSPALPQGRAFDVDPPPPPPPRSSTPPQPMPSDRMSWLRRQLPEAHTLTGDGALLLPLSVARSNCHHARLIAPKITLASARSADPLVVYVDVGDCGVGTTIEAVRRLVPHVSLLLVYNAPPGSAKAEEEASAAATAAAAAAPPAATLGLPPPPPPLPVALYEKQDLARQLMVELLQPNRSCTVGYIFRAIGPDGLINKTSVLFVSVSFILLMVISLSWLIFYYVQRFRYLHAKERLSRRLGNAAKKALTKIPVKVLKTGDKDFPWIGDQCAVCIEPYRCGESVRILPCRHFYHKSCIDPWLLDQRSCPLCKLDILKACGLHVHRGSQASLLDAHLSAEHSHTAAASAASAAVGNHAAAVSVSITSSAAASVNASGTAVQVLPTLHLISAELATGGCGSGCACGRLAMEASSSSNSQSGEGGVQVTVEPPDVQYHRSNCGGSFTFLSRRRGSASSSDDGPPMIIQQQQQQQQQPTAEVCYPLVHRHHGSG